MFTVHKMTFLCTSVIMMSAAFPSFIGHRDALRLVFQSLHAEINSYDSTGDDSLSASTLACTNFPDPALDFEWSHLYHYST